MPSNTMHIYHVEMGYVNDIRKSHWVYARNARLAKEWCKQQFKSLHYSYFKAIMVGEATKLMGYETTSLSDDEIEMIENTIAKDGDRYAEHRYRVSGV